MIKLNNYKIIKIPLNFTTSSKIIYYEKTFD